MIFRRHTNKGARIVSFGAILASFLIARAATLDINIVSPTGVTNLTRLFITGSVGDGNILIVTGTNITGLSTNGLVSGDTATITNLNVYIAYISNFYATNIYATNIYTTNLYAEIANFVSQYVSNSFIINGKNNNVTVTNVLSLLSLSTNSILRIGPTNNVTIIANGTGVLTNDGAGNFGWNTNFSTSSGSGSGVSTAVTPLGLSGTNVTGFDCSTNNMSYTLTLAGHYLFGSSTFANLQNKTTNMFFTLGLQQDSSGGWVPKFTNTIVVWADGNQPVIKTNANAVSYLYFHSSLFTNGTLVGSPNINIQ